jgi:hypothetical protein
MLMEKLLANIKWNIARYFLELVGSNMMQLKFGTAPKRS